MELADSLHRVSMAAAHGEFRETFQDETRSAMRAESATVRPGAQHGNRWFFLRLN